MTLHGGGGQPISIEGGPIRKRHVTRACLLAVLTLAFLVGTGPRPRMGPYHPKSVILPEDLDLYLAQGEAGISGLRPGTQKQIVWKGHPGQKTDRAIVYLHGFSATRGELSPVVEDVAAALGANVFFTRFTGHGLDGSSLARAQAVEWLDDAFEALAIGRRIGNRVAVVGMSTGGLLATWLAAYGEPMDALVLLSPNYGLKDSRSQILFWPWGMELGKVLVGAERSWDPTNLLQERYWTTRYPLESLRPMLALFRDMENRDLKRVRCPVLGLYTPQDDRVDTGLIERNFSEFGTQRKELIRLDQIRHHVLAGSAISPETTGLVEDKILGFLKGI